MEKIKFPPLVEHLKEYSEEYNQLYYQQELKSGKLDASLFLTWIVRVIEPIVVKVTEAVPESLPAVFKAFYSRSIILLSGNLALTYEAEYEKAWALCRLIPQLTAKQPLRIINALNTALFSLRLNQPERVADWIRLMNKVAGHCRTTEEFLNCGRLSAWLCGMAHLREKVIQIFPDLGEEIQNIFKNEKLPSSLDTLLKTTWGDNREFEFGGVAGGFQGYGHDFIQPPLVAVVNGIIVASDGSSSSALFADALGTVLIKDVPLAPERITALASTSGLKLLVEKDLSSRLDFDDITSCVNLNSSLVLTRSTSHYLFIYTYPAA